MLLHGCLNLNSLPDISGVMLMQRGANPTISNGRGQKPVELCSDVWLRETIGSYTEYWERMDRFGKDRRDPGGKVWKPPTSQPDDVEVPCTADDMRWHKIGF